ncbi:hypothetical protein LZ30DRAFT_545245, partial [Colletotrichum cereale]
MDDKIQLFASTIMGSRRENHELTEIQRVAITAFVLAGRTHKEAAAVFGCSRAAVTKTIQRFNTTQS